MHHLTTFTESTTYISCYTVINGILYTGSGKNIIKWKDNHIDCILRGHSESILEITSINDILYSTGFDNKIIKQFNLSILYMILKS
jgi:hypothetical protein